MLYGVDFTWTPLDVIECEQRYPGVLDDVMTVLWQRGLIKRQMSDETADKEEPG